MSDESPIFPVPDGGEYIDERGNTRPTQKFVSFRFEAAENVEKSRAKGQRVFEKVLIMRQHYPGSKDSLDREMLRWPEGSDQPIIMEPDFWMTFRDVAEKWMANQAQMEAGTPLALLNIGVAEMAGLKAAGIGSVEMLAALPDTGLRVVEGARALRDKAARYLDAMADGAPLAKAEAEAREAKEAAQALKDELAELRAELARLRQGDEAAPPRAKRSRDHGA